MNGTTFSLGTVPRGTFDACEKAVFSTFGRSIGEHQIPECSTQTHILGMTSWTEKDKREIRIFIQGFAAGRSERDRITKG